ncbi:hypothetical protein MHB44_18630 [Lysinibacillus sp. FSL H8-0500]|uniref:hypothetical protein n=1 Tax=Lysinibacillus sp. FSL H8-0500 TaxID=2921393 RepID=UPI0031018AA1
MKRIISIICMLAILSLTTLTADAASHRTIPEEEFLSNFLSTLMKESTTQVYSQISDERANLASDIDINKLNAVEKEKIEYVLSGQQFRDSYNKEPIQSFEILTGDSVVKDEYTTVLAKLHFVNDGISIVPFNVVKDVDGFKIVFTLDDIEKSGYKVIRESATKEVVALETPDVSQKSTIVQPMYSGFNLKDDYSFSYLYGTIYGIDTFSMTKWVGNIDGSQYNDAYPTWQSNASVIYSIVKQHWYGDDVWGSTTNPIVTNGAFDVYFQGKNNNFQNAQIRITNTTGAYPRSKGEGKVYQCDN